MVRHLCECGCGKQVNKLESRFISGHNSRGRCHSKEAKEKIRKARIGTRRSKETVAKMVGENNPMYGKHHTEITKAKMSSSNKISLLWQNPEYKEKQLKAIFAGLELRPTKPERRLRNKLNHLFQNEYKYVGDGDTFIGGKCPDFININGQKKIIEMFGDYWHGKKRTGRTKQQEENQRIKHFAKYGYRTLIIWECELKDISKLKKRLILFHRIL